MKVDPTVVLCEASEILGDDITIGSGTIVHPKAVIDARKGAISIGANCIVEERATIVNLGSETMVIGDNNVFEVESVFEGRGMGSGNVLEPQSYCSPRIELGNACVVGTRCTAEIYDGPMPMDEIVFYGPFNRYHKATYSFHREQHSDHLNYLRDVLPKYNNLMR